MDKKWLFVFVNGGWWLKITDPEQLVEYEDRTGSRYGEALCDYSMQKESVSDFSAAMAQIMELRADNKSSPFQLMTRIQNEIAFDKVNSLFDRGVLYFNRRGGYNSIFRKEDEEQFVRRERILFPQYTEEDIRIKKWGDGGRHYYAYIGDVELRDGDQMKWNTYDEAYSFAVRYVASA